MPLFSSTNYIIDVIIYLQYLTKDKRFTITKTICDDEIHRPSIKSIDRTMQLTIETKSNGQDPLSIY